MDDYELLNRYLDALASGTEPDSTEVDPELVATVRYLSDLGKQSQLDSSFVDSLEETLMFNPSLTFASTAEAHPRLQLLSPTNSAPVPAESAGRRHIPNWVKAALVASLLILIGGVWLTQRYGDRNGNGQIPAGGSIQAPTTPTAEANLGAPLVDLLLPADTVPPAGMASVYLTLDVMPADSTATWAAHADVCCPGVKVYFIVSGAVRVTSDGPAQLIPGGDNAATEEIAAGTETSLEPGDAIVLRNEFSNSWTSAEEPVEILAGALFGGFLNSTINPVAWEFGPSVWKDQGINLPGGPYRLTLLRREVAPEEKIPLPENGVHQFAVYEGAGVVGVTSDGTISFPDITKPAEIYMLVIETLPSEIASPTAG